VDEWEEITMGTVAVYCNPTTYPSVNALKMFPDRLAIAVGVHPKMVSHPLMPKFTPYRRS